MSTIEELYEDYMATTIELFLTVNKLKNALQDEDSDRPPSTKCQAKIRKHISTANSLLEQIQDILPT